MSFACPTFLSLLVTIVAGQPAIAQAGHASAHEEAGPAHEEAGPAAPALDWPQFRGPGGLAVADGPAIPKTLGPGQNELWRVALPPGHSSPCIVGPAIFVTGFEHGRERVVALERSTGAELWSRSFVGDVYPHAEHDHAVPALTTPCSDGRHVAVYLATYGLVCLDLDGEVVWRRRWPHPGHGFGVGSSPILADGKVILSRDGAPDSAIYALDVASGETVWMIPRTDCIESHGTPFLWRNAGRDEIVVGGTGRVAGHDLKSGAPLWHVGGVTIFACTTPTADAETLYFAAWSTPNATGRNYWEAGFGQSLDISEEEIKEPGLLFTRLDLDGDDKVYKAELPASRGKDAFGFIDKDGDGAWSRDEFLGLGKPSGAPGENVLVAIQRGGEGDVTATHVRWRWTRGLPYVASPLLHRGRIWLARSGGMLTCLDAASGECLFDRARVDDRSEYYMSPVGAGEHVLAGSADGSLYMLKADGPDFVIEHSARFDEQLFATPAVLDGRVYLRTKSTLWAFGD